MKNNISILLKLSVLKLISFYQKTFSPDHGPFSLIHPWSGTCKFRPTCSEYAYQAIEKYGLLKGSIKAINRICRCNPWSKGGWDKP
ncbi:MAG: membrane protein insertion efficiency factor YidD [Patescibacteria group bacterium]|nr:membrane protein insertion efficiency factor YidD [Patescibacteria group bacterium]MDD5164460.1 membrane protein insertion efficiency factor YidD [Patescibacteria group bacterium]MDD5534379.1 membrane protein insertion efficiency factor YidD [Patescibacteria group bacterium]